MRGLKMKGLRIRKARKRIGTSEEAPLDYLAVVATFGLEETPEEIEAPKQATQSQDYGDQSTLWLLRVLRCLRPLPSDTRQSN